MAGTERGSERPARPDRQQIPSMPNSSGISENPARTVRRTKAAGTASAANRTAPAPARQTSGTAAEKTAGRPAGKPSEKKSRRAAKRRRRRKTLLLCLCCALLLALLAAGLGIFLSQRQKTAPSEALPGSSVSQVESAALSAEQAAETAAAANAVNTDHIGDTTAAAEPAPAGKNASCTISFAGDCTFSSYYGDYSSNIIEDYYEEYGESYFFQNVRDIFEADDLTVTNFEGTLTTSTDRVFKSFNFKSDPSYVGILKAANIECVNVANNHTHDYSDSGYEETIKTLDSAGVSWFAEENTCLLEVNGILVGFSGIYECEAGLDCMDQAVQNVEDLRAAGAEIIVCQFHWGDENSYCPNSYAIKLAHAVVDAGADLVIGHHPHVLQGIELYKGKYICYSLGNFCFGGNPTVNDKDTMIVQATFNIVDGVLKPMEYKLIPCSISTDSYLNTFCPTPAIGEEADRIREKIYLCCSYLDGGISDRNADGEDYDSISGE